MTLSGRPYRALDGVRTCIPRLLVLCLGLFLAGCASGPNANPADPLEPLNRSVYKFNDAVDRTVFKPVATTYRDVTPSLVQRGVSNFFNNLADAWSVVNNVLQLKGEAAGDSFFRFGVNTFVGLGGILDVATEMRIERHTEDFGQTLGHWGVGPGPYIVLPLLGPSNLRDTAALPVDVKGDAVTHVEDVATRNTLWALRATDQRADLLKAEAVLDQAALDKYSFIRDAYLQRRRNAVYDGDPPEEAPVDEAVPPESPPR
jgi:phospholipid-binding lipoprotein MlaA